jgi:DNA-binding transcriptional LysR family regulator
MNLRFVEAFYWVASLKSISRAAEKLFLTQSAMSSRIATLEEELGVLLLDRSDKQFKLTGAGARFLVHANKLLEMQREIKTEMGSGVDMAVSMRIGAIESVLHSWLIPWLEQLRAEQPGLELDLTVETTPILTEQVQRGTLDLAFAVLPASADGVRHFALPPMEMAFVGHPGLHQKAKYELAELAEMECDLARFVSQTSLTPQKSARYFIHFGHGATGAGQLWRGAFAARGCGAANRVLQSQTAGMRCKGSASSHPRQLPCGP